MWIAGVRNEWRELWSHYHYRVNYATCGNFAILSDGLPYIAYEHGTIRSLPFDDSQSGRLCRAAYESATAVLITNADYIVAERRMEFEERRRIWCPHGFDHDVLEHFDKKNNDTVLAPQPVRILAPARHDWCNGDVNNDKGNDRIIHAVALLSSEQRQKLEITFFSYGTDVAASKALIEQLGVSSNFRWIDPQPRDTLWLLYRQSHAVLDQFHIPAIGGVGSESLALGCRLITRDTGALAEFFNEQPPLLPAHTPEEIAAQIKVVLDDPTDEAHMGPAAADWFRRRHGSEAVISAFEQAFALINEEYALIA